MASKIKLNEVVLTSPNGLVEKSISMGDDGKIELGDGSVDISTINGLNILVNDNQSGIPLLRVWAGNQTQFAAIATKRTDTFYIVTKA